MKKGNNYFISTGLDDILSLRRMSSLTLTALKPRPECCIDTFEFGTLVLQGCYQSTGLSTTDIEADWKSLSTLEPSDDGSDDEQWKLVPIWTSSELGQFLSPSKFWIQRLGEIFFSDDGQRMGSRIDPIQLFLLRSERAFNYLLDFLKLKIVQAKTSIMDNEWSIGRIRILHNQLEDLESEITPLNITLSQDFSTLNVEYTDVANRQHEILLNLTSFPSCIHVGNQRLPDASVSGRQTDFESIPNYKKQKSDLRTIRDICEEFIDKIIEYQQLWNDFDDLDSHAWVLEQNTNRSTCCRSIILTERAKLTITVNPSRPRLETPKMQIIGSQAKDFDALIKEYVWNPELSLRANLETCFRITLPHPNCDSSVNTMNQDCGICFGLTTERFKCENSKCARPYHRACLEKWLASLISSRISFDTILGECPYCKDPIAVQMEYR
jgi:FANCL C-terminal domain/FANCL UBC-like domain 3